MKIILLPYIFCEKGRPAVGIDGEEGEFHSPAQLQNQEETSEVQMGRLGIPCSRADAQGELMKVGICLDKNTISKILREFRRRGKVRKSLRWSQFIRNHLEGLYACGFLHDR